MRKAAIYLTNYVIHNGKVHENERPIYEYGFQVALETPLTFSICTILAASMHRLKDEFIFFTIFIPLRSYGGGFHFDRYAFCFLFSCFAFTCTLYISRFLALPQAAFWSIPVLLLCILHKFFDNNGKLTVHVEMDSRGNFYFPKKEIHVGKIRLEEK